MFWHRVTLLIGCGAILGIVGAIVLVSSKRVTASSPIDRDLFARPSEVPANIRGNRTVEEKALWEAFAEKQQAQREATPPVPVAVAPVKIEPRISITDPALVSDESSGIENIESKRERIATEVAAFFQASTIEAKLQHVRDAERVRPLMMSYYAREPMSAWKWRGLGRAVRVDEPGYRFGYVQALFEDANSANLIVEETADGRYLIDWEYLVRYGDLSWADFRRMKPSEPKLLRLIASRPTGTPTVSALAPASSEWLELRHPEESGTVLGYFDRTDPQYAQLVEHLNAGKWKDVPVTLLLCFPNEPSRLEGEGVRIAGVQGKGWIILDKPRG